MDLDFQLLGAREMEQVLDSLPEAMQKNVLTSAVRGGASVISKAAKAKIKADGTVRTGLLHRSITVKVKRYTRDGIIYAAVGPSRSIVGTTQRGRRIVPANYAHLVEFGTRHSKAAPFLRPALDQNKRAVFSGMTKRATKGLAREVAKLRRATT